MKESEIKEYQERMGSPEMEYLQYLLENPEISKNIKDNEMINLEMNEKEHKGRHEELHKYLEELVVDFMQTGKDLSATTVIELMDWSFAQTKKPTQKGDK